MNKNRKIGLVLTSLIVLFLFFILLYFFDNKYQIQPPYGKDGVIELTESDLNRNSPLFLIDGWLLSDRRVIDQPTYIGEFSSLQRGNKSELPHGSASYKLNLRYSGTPMVVTINFPQIFTTQTILLDGQVLSQGKENTRISFSLTQGDHMLEVKTFSSYGYYSGIYHPPILGRTNYVFSTILVQCIGYAIAFFVPLALCIFTLALWHSTKDREAFWFGLLSCSFSLYVSYYFIRLFSMPFEQWWYLVQSLAFYGLCYCTVRLTALIGGVADTKAATLIQQIQVAYSMLLLILAASISLMPWVVWLHGALTDIYYMFTFCAVLLLVYRSKVRSDWEGRLTLLACTVFGTGLLVNLFFSNLFEPILFFWQFEWCGLFLIVLFGATMAARNKRILLENKEFSEHLEFLVQQRTEEIWNLLQERKAFFADMAHDLKAPIFAMHTFIQAIREHDTGVDHELLRYIDQVEQKQQEMDRRVRGINILNKLDEIVDSLEAVSVWTLLKEVYQTHHMAAEVQSVHFEIELPATDGNLFAPPRKLSIIFENLIFNSLRATPSGGRITIAAEIDDCECHFTITDTGKGINQEELSHIFKRFFVGKENKGIGSGLGLYIVKSIVEELGGEITVSTKPEHGTVFYIDFPLMPVT